MLKLYNHSSFDIKPLLLLLTSDLAMKLLTLVRGSMKSSTKDCIKAELEFARKKFPSNEYILAALTEEVGELAQALIDQSRGKQSHRDVFAEDGDRSFPYQYMDSFDHAVCFLSDPKFVG